LPWESRKLVSLELVRAVVNTNSVLNEMASVEKLFELIVPLLRDDPDAGFFFFFFNRMRNAFFFFLFSDVVVLKHYLRITVYILLCAKIDSMFSFSFFFSLISTSITYNNNNNNNNNNN
jgi:hypothetical protein